jgi:hypothetical protein
MSDPNGLYLWLRPTSRLGRLSAFGSVQLTRLQALPPPVRLACVLMLVVLLVSVTGCAMTSPPSRPAEIPAPPRLSQPLPEMTYSEHVRRLLESWRERLTGTPAM